RRFHENITVPLGDHAARIEMNKTHPDIQKVRQGFIRGGNHIDDVDGMFDLYRRFARASFMQRAIQAWEAADGCLVQLDEAGSSVQREIASPSPSPPEILATLAEMASINEKLTPIQNQFVE